MTSGTPPGGQVDLGVDDGHDAERQVEGADDGVEHVAGLLAENAQRLTVDNRLRPRPPSEWRETDDGRHDPDNGGHQTAFVLNVRGKSF